MKTRATVLWTSVLSEPLQVVYALLAFVLYRDLGATPFQVAALTMLKPLVSVLSMYWRWGSLKGNVVWAGVLGRLPFLAFPFVDEVWFFVAAAAVHMLFARAATPAWMEILKRSVGKGERERLFSLGSALGYGEGVVLAIGVGMLLDHEMVDWRVLFCVSALVGMVGVWLQHRMGVRGTLERREMGPWRSAWKLVRSRRDFAAFQWGFMACGFGIMLIQPALPVFFTDVLHLSYTDLSIALSVCKGLGFVAASPFWADAMQKRPIQVLSRVVFGVVGVFPLLLLLAPLSVFWVYLAYVVYGVGQGGSHLVWNLSGPTFARDEESVEYTAVNIVMVGMRGAVGPPLGGLLCMGLGPVSVLLCGMGCCFYGSWWMAQKKALRKSASWL